MPSMAQNKFILRMSFLVLTKATVGEFWKKLSIRTQTTTLLQIFGKLLLYPIISLKYCLEDNLLE